MAQTYQNWEAIVVDNFSDDNTEEVVRSFADSRIRYIKNHNYGIIAVSRNKALDMAKGDWICFLDSDDSWFSNKLDYIIPYLKDNDIVYHGYRVTTPKTHFWQRRNFWFYEIKEVSVPYIMQRRDPLNPSCTSVSRIFLADTRFCEDAELRAVEDYDFFLQIIAKKPRIKYLKAILTWYELGGNSFDGKAVDRDILLAQKWASYLNDEERKEVDYIHKLDTARMLLAKNNFVQAKELYKEAIHSRIWFKKVEAFKGIVKCRTRIKQIF